MNQESCLLWFSSLSHTEEGHHFFAGVVICILVGFHYFSLFPCLGFGSVYGTLLGILWRYEAASGSQ